MKIQLLSDLHLEANPGFEVAPHPQADVLVLAGDIGSYQTRPDGRCMEEPDWGLRRFSPRAEHAGWPVPVVFVPGNHEYDGLDFDETRTALRATCERLGLVWLERDTWVYRGVRFVGTTLWSDYDALAQSPQSIAQSMAQPGQAAINAETWRLKQRDKAFRAANFYLAKMQTRREGQLFDAAAMREEALLSQAWLRARLNEPFDGSTVVVTHFAPSLRSADPRYGLTPGTSGFCNALDEWLPVADLWLHGHLHCPHDYRVGRCRVVANPLGYALKGEQVAFRPDCLVEVP